MNPLDLLEELKETGTLESASLAWLEQQPREEDESLIGLAGTAPQIKYAETLRLEFLLRHATNWAHVVWLANAQDDAAWWIAVGIATKKCPLMDQWALRVLWLGRLSREQ